MRTPRGFSRAAPTSRPSRSALATLRSPRRRSTCTRCRTRTTPRCTRSPGSAGGRWSTGRTVPVPAKGGGLVRVGGEYVGVGDRGDAVDQVETADDHQHDRREQDQTVAAAFRVPPASASGWFGCWTPVPLPRSHRAQPEAASCQWGETGAASLRRSTGPMSCKWSMPAGVRRWRSPAASQATGAALSPAATFPPGYSLLDDGPGIATARPEGRDLWPWRWGPLALNGPLVAALKVVARGPRERCPRRAVFHKRAIDPGRVPGVMSPSGSRGDREGENG